MNVYDASLERIRYTLREFDDVCVSFSGGKDSGVMLNLVAKILREEWKGRKVCAMHLDYECQYQMTTDYVASVEKDYADVFEFYHICVPFKVTTCTSMFQSFWRPWNEVERDIWVRGLPENAMTAKDFPFYRKNQWDYDFQEEFGRWLHKVKGAKRTACLVGIRTQESLNRWRAIFSDKNYKIYDGKRWTKDFGNGVVNVYPIYDYTTEDIWTANARNGWRYNKLYDLYYMAGVNIDQMRVASPFISEGQDALKLYKVIEPHTWGKLVSRVNGVNFTGIYGGTTAMGWKSITKPSHYTWKQYMEFLLNTLPEPTRKSYEAKLATSIKFWREKGGCLSEDVITKLRENGVAFEVGTDTNYNTDKLPVRMDYLDDIDIAEFKEIPTFKRMCVCIMKNDHLCKYMGFSQTKSEMERRRSIMEKYKNL